MGEGGPLAGENMATCSLFDLSYKNGPQTDAHEETFSRRRIKDIGLEEAVLVTLSHLTGSYYIRIIQLVSTPEMLLVYNERGGIARWGGGQVEG